MLGCTLRRRGPDHGLWSGPGNHTVTGDRILRPVPLASETSGIPPGTDAAIGAPLPQGSGCAPVNARAGSPRRPAPPDADAPYLLYSVAGDPDDGSLRMMDWSGIERGAFAAVRTPTGGRGRPRFAPRFAPDGTRALLLNDVVTAAGIHLGSVGAVLGGAVGEQIVLTDFRWSDDSRTLCSIGVTRIISRPLGTSSPGSITPTQVAMPVAPATLFLTTPGGEPRRIATLVEGGTTQNLSAVLACSPPRGTALTATLFLPGPSGLVLQLVRLADGAVLASRSLTSGPGATNTLRQDYVATPDGTLLAQNGSDHSSVVDLRTSTPMGPELPGRIWLLSADGSRAVLTPGGAVNGSDGAMIVEVRGGHVVWRTPIIVEGAKARPDPSRPDIAVGLRDGTIWLIPSGGEAHMLAHQAGLLPDVQIT